MPLAIETINPHERNTYIRQETQSQLNVPSYTEMTKMENGLSTDQSAAYRTIKNAYDLYNLILSMVRSNRHIAVATASSGIAALLVYIVKRAILCPKNDQVEIINNMIMNMISPPEMTYYSFNA
ncbi:hypothetical protein BGZ46_009869 [Entomortierella lignicola]|nr:hypothetical protein BGZ46_009869 [Entomortierella lignicola]